MNVLRNRRVVCRRRRASAFRGPRDAKHTFYTEPLSAHATLWRAPTFSACRERPRGEKKRLGLRSPGHSVFLRLLLAVVAAKATKSTAHATPPPNPATAPATHGTGHFCHGLSQSSGITMAPHHAPREAPQPPSTHTRSARSNSRSRRGNGAGSRFAFFFLLSTTTTTSATARRRRRRREPPSRARPTFSRPRRRAARRAARRQARA